MFGRHDDLSANVEIRTSTFPTRKFSLSEKQTNKKTKNSDQWNHPVNKWDQWRSDLEGRCYQPFPYTLKICMGVAHKGNASSSLVLWGPGPHTGPVGHHTQLCRHKHIRCFVSQRTGLWMVCRVRSSCIPQQRIQILMHKGKAYLIRKNISKYCQKYFCSFLWFCSCFCHHQNVLQM